MPAVTIEELAIRCDCRFVSLLETPSVTKQIKWQMTIGGTPVRPGAEIDIALRNDTAHSECLLLRDTESGTKSSFWVKGTVNIGGKDYLFLQELKPASSNPPVVDYEYIMVRAQGQDKLIAMDPERFSSLSNALAMYLESNQLK